MTEQTANLIIAAITSGGATSVVQWYFRRPPPPLPPKPSDSAAVEAAEDVVEMAGGLADRLTKEIGRLDGKIKAQAELICGLERDNLECHGRLARTDAKVKDSENRMQQDRIRIETLESMVSKIHQNSADAAERGGRRKDEQHD